MLAAPPAFADDAALRDVETWDNYRDHFGVFTPYGDPEIKFEDFENNRQEVFHMQTQDSSFEVLKKVRVTYLLEYHPASRGRGIIYVVEDRDVPIRVETTQPDPRDLLVMHRTWHKDIPEAHEQYNWVPDP